MHSIVLKGLTCVREAFAVTKYIFGRKLAILRRFSCAERSPLTVYELVLSPSNPRHPQCRTRRKPHSLTLTRLSHSWIRNRHIRPQYQSTFSPGQRGWVLQSCAFHAQYLRHPLIWHLCEHRSCFGMFWTTYRVTIGLYSSTAWALQHLHTLSLGKWPASVSFCRNLDAQTLMAKGLGPWDMSSLLTSLRVSAIIILFLNTLCWSSRISQPRRQAIVPRLKPSQTPSIQCP